MLLYLSGLPAMKYQTVIGLEVHAQLNTESKMFCRCSTDYSGTTPNSRVCPICLALPGVLPTINKKAVEYTIMTALALNCSVSQLTKFDRKNYPYPDLMKGYQISQYDAPVGKDGWLEVEVEGRNKRIGITRVHLEEDVAKLLHRTAADGGCYSLVDVNRSGVPLMEVVSEPDMRSPEEARQYLIKMRGILRYLGVSTANMEEGSFRCDANISIRPEGSDELLAKVEVKNMNSFKAVYRALIFEEKRQRKVAERGGKLLQETRGWVEDEGKTVSQRSKEYAHDYRYFPEPDLPPLSLKSQWVDEIKAVLPELPEKKKDRFIKEYGLPLYDADLLTGSREMADYFEKVAGADEKVPAKEISNWILGSVCGIINAAECDIAGFSRKVSPENLNKLVSNVHRQTVNIASGKAVLEEMYKTGKDADTIIKEKGLVRISDTSEVSEKIAEVIEANPRAAADYRAGKEQAVKFLVGQVMRATRGRVNPNMAADLIKEKLKEG